MDIIQQSACVVVNSITVYNNGFLFNCMTMGQALDSMTALAYRFNPLVGAWCLSLAGPTVAQLFFYSDYLGAMNPFLFHHSVLIWLDCFSVMMHCIS